MDSMKKGILNLFESVIQNVFIREPNINAIQEWVSSCDQNKGGITTPPVTPPESRIQIDSAEKKKHNSGNASSFHVSQRDNEKKMGKNARKKLKLRSALDDDISSSNESCNTSSSSSKAHSEISDASKNDKEDSNAIGIDHVYPNGNINYTMTADEIDQIGWATCQYSHSRINNYHVSYKCCLGSFTCPEPGCKFQSRPRLPRNPSIESV